MSRVPISSVDTAWLRMEDPTNLMMITGIMVLGGRLDWKRFRATMEHRLVGRFDRFRQRVIQPALPLGTYYWEDDPDFDLDDHLTRIALPRNSQSALQDAVSQLMSTPLDFSKPLWQLHVVEKFGKGSVVICRLHHCIADGIALVHVLLSLTDASPDAPWPTAPLQEQSRGWNPLGPLRATLKATRQVTDTLLHEGMETLAHPAHAIDLARLGASTTAALGKLLLLWPDPKTVYKGELGIAKRATWSKPIPLKEVKAIGRVIGGTVNDVLLTAVTGALRRYMISRGEPVDGVTIRAVVPVNLRPLDVTPDLGNRFSLIFLPLPVGIAAPLDRLRELKRQMDNIKGSHEAAVTFGILNAMGMTPPQIQDMVVDIFGAKGTGVMTNVPGPQQKLYLAGAPLDTIMFWVPQSGHLGLGVSIISYAGEVWLGIATDQGLVPDPDKIIAGFQAEFNELDRLLRKKKAKPDVKAMLWIMDEAAESLEAVRARSKDKAVCQAKTQAGRPCKRRALPGSEFCQVHQKRGAKAKRPGARTAKQTESEQPALEPILK